MQFTFLTLALSAGAAWYAWRAWSAVQRGSVQARLLPLPGMPVRALTRAEHPEAFQRAVAVFIGCGCVCLLLAVLHALGVLPGTGP